MRLHSTAFTDGGPLPERYTCDGDAMSPPFAWTDLPAGTRSVVLICDDPDAPGQVFHHWTAFDIPPDLTALAEGAAAAAAFRQAVNDYGEAGYGPPCPPRRDRPHRYRFRLLALSVETLPVGAHPACQAVERAARPHVLGTAEVTATYGRR